MIRAIRFPLAAVGIVVASISVVLWLANSTPVERPRFASARRTSSRAADVSSRAVAAEPRVPLYSEDWTEDSGQGLATRYSLPITDPRSLDQVRASDEGRSQRGIASLRRELSTVDRQTPAGRAQAMQLEVFLGLLNMSIGEFVEADRWLAEAQAADPGCPPMVRMNIEALRGVAALRRGETENCVACCNGSSCIFPLTPEAVHQSPSGSREAIRRFNTYLETRPEDLGVKWLLNVAHMTLGQYPAGVPKDKLIPLGPFQSDGGVGRLENVAGRVGLNVRGANMAGGAIVDDFNGDGLPDVFTSTKDPTRGCTLFINKGDGTFEDRSARAGLDLQVGALNCNQADYDNDGDLDILLLRGGVGDASTAFAAPQRRRRPLLRRDRDGRALLPHRFPGRRLG